MKLPNTHPALVVGSVSHDMSHLDAFGLALTGKGRENGTDLQVLVKFSNHVVTERALHGQAHDTEDHRGTKRVFDPDRYVISQRLPVIIRDAFSTGALCFVSKDYSGYENLMMIELENGVTWSIVFCFEPLQSGVVMEILSTHRRSVYDIHASRKPLVFYARMCLFRQNRVPKN